MHILLAVLGGIGALLFFVIRANQARKAALELGEVATDIKNFNRRRNWQKKLDQDVVRNNTDPVMSAAIIICAIVQAAGGMSAREVSAISCAMQSAMGLSDSETKQIVAQARFLSKEAADPNVLISKALPPINNACTDDEKRELLDMAGEAAQIEGEMTDIQMAAIRHLKHSMGLA